MRKVLIIGASGFMGNAIYKEISPYMDTYGTYCRDNVFLEQNNKFFQFDMELEDIDILLQQLKPTYIITALRGNFNAQIDIHQRLVRWIKNKNAKILFLSSANVFDNFHNYPSYEYDKTYSESVYGRLKIKIENTLLRLPTEKYAILRIPMIFGASSPRILELKQVYNLDSPIEVFPNVIMNVACINKFMQQIHYIINHDYGGIYHLGSDDLIHHSDLILEICRKLELHNPFFKQVYDTNNDHYLAVLPKNNALPKHLLYSVQDVVNGVLITRK